MFLFALPGALALGFLSLAGSAFVLGFSLFAAAAAAAAYAYLATIALVLALMRVSVAGFADWAFARVRFLRLRLILSFFGGAALMSFGLAGCAPTGNLNADIATFNAQVANDLPTACALVASADAAFQTVAATGKLSAAALSAEKSAMAGVASICANPGAVNAATALQTLASAYAAVVEAGKPGT